MSEIKRIIQGTIIEQISNDNNVKQKDNISNYNYFSEGLSEGIKFNNIIFFLICFIILLILILI